MSICISRWASQKECRIAKELYDKSSGIIYADTCSVTPYYVVRRMLVDDDLRRRNEMILNTVWANVDSSYSADNIKILDGIRSGKIRQVLCVLCDSPIVSFTAFGFDKMYCTDCAIVNAKAKSKNNYQIQKAKKRVSQNWFLIVINGEWCNWYEYSQREYEKGQHYQWIEYFKDYDYCAITKGFQWAYQAIPDKYPKPKAKIYKHMMALLDIAKGRYETTCD